MSFVVQPMKLRGTKAKFILGSSLEVTSQKNPSDDQVLKGLSSKLLPIQDATATELIQSGTDGEGCFVDIVVPAHFPPGSVMLFATRMDGMTVEGDQGSKSLESLVRSGADQAFEKLEMIDLNVVLFRTDGEERDMSEGRDGIYNVPGLHPPLTYCGLEGWMHALRYVIKNNDLGHPLCAHLRDGPWAFDYVVGRLKKWV